MVTEGVRALFGVVVSADWSALGQGGVDQCIWRSIDCPVWFCKHVVSGVGPLFWVER